ncbi:MAG: HAD family phosphatase [Gemmatimonadales bacterium]|jgi:HAD superfamily hydrolase (TIGR01509 family)
MIGNRETIKLSAIIFDLDGTLVQTERLKALSYAKAAVELRPDLDEAEIVKAFKDVVGLPRHEVAQRLTERFDLATVAAEREEELGVQTPWQVLVQLRLQIYERMLDDPSTILHHSWPHSLALLRQARERGCKTALATMSHCEQVRRILDVLDLRGSFDFIATRDDVEHGKPDPEIYTLISRELAVAPAQCLVIEDSAAGVQAASAARMKVVALATSVTREHLHDLGLLPSEWIVDEPDDLLRTVDEVFGCEPAGGGA